MNTDGSTPFFIVSVEHASAEVPELCGDRLDAFIRERQTHEIYDPGAKSVAEQLSKCLACPVITGDCTRLAIDLNRSLGNPKQFSPPIFDCEEELKAKLINQSFIPFRSKVRTSIDEGLRLRNQVVHISVHSFTKNFFGIEREVDLGILFDESRGPEANLAHSWIKTLRTALPNLNVNANEPYQGIEDGHTTALRKRYCETEYIGLEVELSQSLDLDDNAELFGRVLFETLSRVLE